jgi:hypothetical protein
MARRSLFSLATGVPFGRGCLPARSTTSRVWPHLTNALILLDDLASFGNLAVVREANNGFAFAFSAIESGCHSRSFPSAQDHFSRCSKWVCFCTFPLHSPASWTSRGSPDGAPVALFSGDRCAIWEGVPARTPRPPVAGLIRRMR